MTPISSIPRPSLRTLPPPGADPAEGTRRGSASAGVLPCGGCPLAWCDAPWSSGRTGCPACAGRGQ